MENVITVEHPLIQHKLSYIRDKNTSSKDFRELVEEVAMLMAYEVTRDFPVEETVVETPMGPAQTKVIAGKSVAVIPILRAGLGMTDGILKIVPNAKVGHIGLYRDHDTLEAVQYYVKVPSDLGQREVIVVDPMLATGGSAVSAVSILKERSAHSIRLMCLIAVPEGIRKFHESHPDVKIYTASVDSHLDENGYIFPGLGDAGDRLFGTK